MVDAIHDLPMPDGTWRGELTHRYVVGFQDGVPVKKSELFFGDRDHDATCRGRGIRQVIGAIKNACAGGNQREKDADGLF